ncbi:MAG: YkvA family protein [Thermodesulfobacteriota bacterium]
MELLRRLIWYLKIMIDSRTPWSARMLFVAAVIYLLVPTDAIPDVLFGFGLIDDATLAALLIWMSLRLVPDNVLQGMKNEK